MAQGLSDLAGSLARAGRGNEAATLLDEAEGLGRGLKNDALLAGVLNERGDAYFYQGDLKSAAGSYEQASRLASHAADKEVLLISKMNLAKVAVEDGRSRTAINDLRTLAQQADSQGRKYISVVSSVLLGEAMIRNKEYAAARQELQRSLGRAERLGLRLEVARVHYLLGEALRLSGNASESASQYREAGRGLDEIRKEQGAEHLAERYDLKPIYAATAQLTQ